MEVQAAVATHQDGQISRKYTVFGASFGRIMLASQQVLLLVAFPLPIKRTCADFLDTVQFTSVRRRFYTV